MSLTFFDRPAEIVARELLGTLVVSSVDGETTAGRVVETEAYLGYDDPASHGYRHRRNQRNAALFGPPGTWYVYLSYGIHWCANLVCEAEGKAAAVLLRALEPVEGLDVMRRRRRVAADRDLCSGPGRLCQALGITRSLDGLPMPQSPVVVVFRQADGAPLSVAETPRIGITKAAKWPLRFVIAGSPWASGKRSWVVTGP
ncbi:MAG: DNA-3-methyladenine glycosylase [Gemmatimonadales bacterium]|nr:DNA-3-methyladenine glycosylase [Gemmatimonadales bacterium]